MIAYIKKVLDQRGHAVVCLAEGAGQVRVCLVQLLADSDAYLQRGCLHPLHTASCVNQYALFSIWEGG